MFASDSEMIDWQERYKDKVTTADKAVSVIKPGDKIFIGSGAAEPQVLVRALVDKASSLADTKIFHIMTLGIAPYTEPKFTDQFRHNAFFIGANTRQAVAEGRADYTPIFLSEIPALFRTGRIPIDVALIQVTPPDKHGYCSYGVSVDIVKSAAESADMVIAEVNSRAPRTMGDSFIHVNDIDLMVPSDEPLLYYKAEEPSDIAYNIGKNISKLIEDGSTLQMGIGGIPDAVLKYLANRKDLGIHTEMFSDGIIELVEKGVITNRKKTIHKDKIIASFCMGSQRLYDFVDNNPLIEFHPTEYVNDPFVIAQNEKMVAINAAIEVDLTGQVCSDSLGELFYSGIGGQVDFIRGAARSKGGKPIIALPSTARNGTVSRIVPTLKPGAGVVTSRGDVHYVVTEWGVAYLHGKSIRERALALISIAHPRFRAELLRAAKQRGLVLPEEEERPFSGVIYPEELETEMKLTDGRRIVIRPLKPTDEEAWIDFFHSLSPQSIYHRFFGILKGVPYREVQKYMDIDYNERMALVAVLPEEALDRIIAVARYELDNRTNFAEFAIVVTDEFQEKGIGKQMLQYLAKIARSKGIKGFTAEVMADNERMMNLFRDSGYRMEAKMESGTWLVKLYF